MIETFTLALGDSILAGDFDELTFNEITADQRESIVASLRFASERVGYDVEAPGKKG